LKGKKEIIIGFTLLVAAGIVIFGFNFLKGKNLFSSSNSYFAVYDHVDGLLSSSGVQYNGFNVGKVEKIYFHPNKSGDLIVKFSISESGLKLPKNTIAQVSSFDLLGTKGLTLLLKPDSQFYSPGDTLFSGFEVSLKEQVNQQVLPLKNKVEGLISQVDSALSVVQGILSQDFQDDFKSNFSQTMVSLKDAAANANQMVAENRGSFGRIISNVESSTQNLKNNNENLTKIINNTAQISDSLASINIAATFNKVDRAMTDVSAVLERVNKGEGSLGKLLKDEKLYHNLDQASLELDKLLEDMRVNPKRYVQFSVFGKKDKNKPEKKTRTEDQ